MGGASEKECVADFFVEVPPKKVASFRRRRASYGGVKRSGIVSVAKADVFVAELDLGGFLLGQR